MATTLPLGEDRSVSIGRVFQRAFSAITFNPAVILGLALIVGALPQVLLGYLFYRAGVGNPEAIRTGSMTVNSMIGAFAISTTVSFVISALVQAALTRAAVSANEGVRASFAESLGTGLRVVVPLIGLSILFGLGIGLGFMLLIVPGIIVMVMWAVAVPSLVIERNGIFNAFSRSAELTSGARWKIFGLFLLLLVIYWLLSVVAGIVGLSASGPGMRNFGVANMIGGAVVGTLFNALWGTVQPSLYVELRRAKEGDSVDSLEQIFA